MEAGSSRSGILYALVAYGTWGLVPLYFNIVGCPAEEIVAHRVLWSGLLLTAIVFLFGRGRDVLACLRNRKAVLMLFASAYLLAFNWYLYVYSATTGHITQASLGYFILPLVNVVAGLLFFGDRLNRLQIGALALATIGVIYLAVSNGEFPWIGIGLAISFAIYGILRKLVPADGIVGLSVETYLLAPAALGWLIYLYFSKGLMFGSVNLSKDAQIILSGVVTTIPLVCFAQAVRRISLVSIGFIQYLSPTLQLLLAVLIYREPFTASHQISFGLIWCGLILFAVDSYLTLRRKRILSAEIEKGEVIVRPNPVREAKKLPPKCQNLGS